MNPFAHTTHNCFLNPPNEPPVLINQKEKALAERVLEMTQRHTDQFTTRQIVLILRQWEPMKNHLANVAALSGDMAAKLNSSSYGFLSGALHDIGKWKEEMLERFVISSLSKSLQDPNVKADTVDHVHAGAIHARNLAHDERRKNNIVGAACLEMIALIILGHHRGLVDFKSMQGELAEDALRERQLLKDIPWSEVPSCPLEVPPDFVAQACQLFLKNQFQPSLAFWVRMVFSCLVDADSLATEEFRNPDKATKRNDLLPVSFPALAAKLEANIQALQDTNMGVIVRTSRHEVSQCAFDAAKLPRGHFTLTAATGTGKTLAALRFALEHIRLNPSIQRIIVVIPYTAVIDQTAEVYLGVMGADLYKAHVIEHHSRFDPKTRKENGQLIEVNELASENYDFSIILTTAVQAYESLYSNKRSRLRKLHNFVNSLIIIDEPQINPFRLRHPIAIAEQELVANYGCTIVRSSATQPEPPPGSREIVTIPGHAAQLADRCQIIFPDDLKTPLPWGIVRNRALQRAQGMTIVPRRRKARELAQEIQNADPTHPVYHLSSLMCANHRRIVSQEVVRLLAAGQSCRLIATPVTQTGVDLDFPYVQQFMSGFDNIIQAAGRAGRHGLQAGVLEIYIPDLTTETGTSETEEEKRRADITKDLILGEFDNPYDPDAIAAYFRYLGGHEIGDEPSVMAAQNEGAFQETAQRMQLIPEKMVTIVVPFQPEIDVISQRIKDYRDFVDNGKRAPAILLRRLQPYTVDIYENEYEDLVARNRNAIQEIGENGLVKFLWPDSKLYSSEFGLLIR